MNNIKFKVWVKPLKQMGYPDELVYNVNLGLIVKSVYINGERIPVKNEDCILLQCSNQTDLNHVLIFEGDLLKGKTRNDEIPFIEPVKVSPHLGFYVTNYDIRYEEIVYENHIYFSDCEVIGNIYEK